MSRKPHHPRQLLAGTLGAAALATIALAGCATRMAWRMPSPDHRMQVELRPRHGRTCVRVAGRLEGCFDGVAAGGLTFSADSRHVAYPVVTGTRWHVMRDGHPGTEWDGIASLALSPDGGHLIYSARDGHSWRLVQDEQPGDPWDSLCASSITLSPDGAHVACVAVQAGVARVVRDGQPGPAYDRIETPHFSPDGTRLAWVAWRGRQATLALDGVAGPFHDFVGAPVFSADSRRVACVVRDSTLWFVVADGVASGPFAAARVFGFTGTGDTLVSVVATPEGEAVRAGDRLGPRYSSIATPAFSRDRGRWGYIARRGDSSVIVLDGAIFAVEEHASNLVLSGDGARHAYIASRTDGACIVDDRGVHRYELLVDGSLVFGRDGRWACLAGDPGRRRLFVAAAGTRRRRAFDWTMVARMTRSPAAAANGMGVDDAVREWIAAEAERMRDSGKRLHRTEN